MDPWKRFVLLIFAHLFSQLVSTPALAAGGELKLRCDGGPDGYYYNALGSARARYGTCYLEGDCDPGFIVCGARTRDLDQSTITPGVDDYVLHCDLRLEDVNCQGYADLTPLGLLADADQNSLSTCSTSGASQTRTFGGGAGLPGPMAGYLITLAQPANNDPNEGIDFCGLLLDTSGLFTNAARTQGWAPGGAKTTIGFNHFLDAFIFEPQEFDLNIRMTGSSRFPGDAGLPVMFARRQCDPTQSGCSVDEFDTGSVTTTDDYITARITIDNNTVAPPRALDVIIEADRAALNPKLTPKDITQLFRPIGGGPPIMNPIIFPGGRSRFDLEVKVAMRRRLIGLFPVDLPFNVRLQDPNITGDVPDAAFQNLGVRPSTGFYDNDSSAGGFFFTQSPVLTGDSLNVRFDAIDGPRQDYDSSNEVRITGAQLVAGEFGASGLSGLDGIQIRREDFVLQGSPDLSPQGLFRAIGTLADPGNSDGIPTGAPATTATVDFTDISIMPLSPALYPNLFCLAFLNPGDTLGSLTALGSAGPGDTFIGNSSMTLAFTNPANSFNQDDIEIRLDYDGELGTISNQTRTRRMDGASPREFGKFTPVTETTYPRQ